ncbi:hypothetical protein [Leucobacter sp. USHLN153]|uniref:hypothetical protein n=1 Tax=Leucobacter sp. USHLN153 TaxID=3081268 RepID=UPI003018D4A0
MSFDDKRTVQLALEIGEDKVLPFPLEGRVTGTSCAAGSEIHSGHVIAEVSGKRVLALSTAVPLWKSLEPGDEGAEVDALRRELIRMGADLMETGPANQAVLDVLDALFSADAEVPPAKLEEVPAEQIMWIPAPAVTMLKCGGAIADEVTAGDEFGTIAGALTAARLTPMPDDLVSGARVLRVAGLEVPMDKTGVVSAPESLAAIAESADYRAIRSAASASGEERAEAGPSLIGELALKSSKSAWAVPASTVYEAVEDVGCVAFTGGTITVRIVGSRLGKTYVLPAQEAEEMPARVHAPGQQPESCSAP